MTVSLEMVTVLRVTLVFFAAISFLLGVWPSDFTIYQYVCLTTEELSTVIFAKLDSFVVHSGGSSSVFLLLQISVALATEFLGLVSLSFNIPHLILLWNAAD